MTAKEIELEGEYLPIAYEGERDPNGNRFVVFLLHRFHCPVWLSDAEYARRVRTVAAAPPALDPHRPIEGVEMMNLDGDSDNDDACRWLFVDGAERSAALLGVEGKECDGGDDRNHLVPARVHNPTHTLELLTRLRDEWRAKLKQSTRFTAEERAEIERMIEVGVKGCAK